MEAGAVVNVDLLVAILSASDGCWQRKLGPCQGRRATSLLIAAASIAAFAEVTMQAGAVGNVGNLGAIGAIVDASVGRRQHMFRSCRGRRAKPLLTAVTSITTFTEVTMQVGAVDTVGLLIAILVASAGRRQREYRPCQGRRSQSLPMAAACIITFTEDAVQVGVVDKVGLPVGPLATVDVGRQR